MLVHQAFRYEVDPNNRTRSGFASHHGAKRVAYNWGRDRISDPDIAARHVDDRFDGRSARLGRPTGAPMAVRR